MSNDGRWKLEFAQEGLYSGTSVGKVDHVWNHASNDPDGEEGNRVGLNLEGLVREGTSARVEVSEAVDKGQAGQ